MVYAVDQSGKYTELSTGWEVKANALDLAWKDIGNRIEKARQQVLNREASPLLYFMELRDGYRDRFRLYRLLEMDHPPAYEARRIRETSREQITALYAEAFNVYLEE